MGGRMATLIADELHVRGVVCFGYPFHPPGQPAKVAHWGIEDPAAVEGSDHDKGHAFIAAFHQLKGRISAFLALPIQNLDPASVSQRLQEIGRMEGATLGLTPAG